MAIVHRVVGDCPGCGGKACFGNVSVSGTTLTRGCGRCRFLSRIPLPAIRKKIVYLDQSLLSSAFKTQDDRAVRAVKRVSELASKQLLVAPHSNLHEDETHLWSGYGGRTPAELMKFIERTARGVEFKSTHEIEHTQAYKGFKAYRQGLPAVYAQEERDAISRDVHEWHNYYVVTVGGYFGDVNLLASGKREAVQKLVEVFDVWMNSKNTFEQDVAAETAAAGEAYLQEYFRYVGRLARGDYAALMDAPIASQCVERLLRLLPEQTEPRDALGEIARYFASRHFAELPCEWLSARIFAQLKAMVRGGAYANREKAVKDLSGIFFDVQHIATYAPYSDAIFVDNAMASLVSHPSVGLKRRFGTEVFSLNTLDGFMEWLDSVEAAMDETHKRTLEQVYGEML